MLAPVRTAAPATTPVSLAELKANMRVTGTADDALIQILLDAAVQHFDGYTGVLGRAMVTQTWTQDFSDFWLDDMVLPLAPVSAATVTYYDTANAQQTLDASIYSLLNDGRGPFLSLNYGMVWPNHYVRPDAIRVTFVAGYGAASAVPAPLKAAIMLRAGRLYSMARADLLLDRETVEGIGTRTWAAVADAAAVSDATESALVGPYRRVGV